jgi:hypothetical protein
MESRLKSVILIFHAKDQKKRSNFLPALLQGLSHAGEHRRMAPKCDVLPSLSPLPQFTFLIDINSVDPLPRELSVAAG